MNLLEQNKHILEEFSKKEFVEAIIIFGSYASNRIKPLSDLDIAILFNKKASEKQKDIILGYGDQTLDIIDFSMAPLSLQFKIITQGRIYDTKSSLKSLKYNITNQWFDFKPRLQKRFKAKGLLVS